MAESQSPQPAAIERLHAFDALRAAMMLLGVVFHAACCYTVATIGTWPYRDMQTNAALDGTCLFLHAFRLPLFFILSGFFAAQLVCRRGIAGMLRNRWQRLAIPLLIAWPLLVALVLPGALFARWRHPLLAAGEAWRQLEVPSDPGRLEGLLLHLWFLYDLFLFCLLAAGGLLLERWLKPQASNWVHSTFRTLLRNGAAPALFALATAATLWPMQTGSFDTSAWLLPPVRVLAAYGLFFWFGWLLFGERAHLEIFRRSARRRLAAGYLAFLLQALCLTAGKDLPPEADGVLTLILPLAGAMACWWLIFGVTGLGLRYFSIPRPWVRYLTDASYWIYLAHLPLIFLIAGVLAPLPWPAGLKFLLVLGATLVLLVLLYHAAVRSTRIGEQLNGRRYPREWPALPNLRSARSLSVSERAP